MCATLAVLLGGTTVVATPIATLTLVSQPGDFVGGDIIGNTYGAGGIVTGSDMSGDETLTLTYPAENLYLFGGAGDDLRGAGTPSRVSFDFVGGATFFVELTFQTDELAARGETRFRV
jgi:hypothetical protein